MPYIPRRHGSGSDTGASPERWPESCRRVAHRDTGRRGDTVVFPGLPCAVEVERVRIVTVSVVRGDLDVVPLGRPGNRPRSARCPVVGLERPHLRQFDGAAHRVRRVDLVASGRRLQRHGAALFVDLDALRGAGGRERGRVCDPLLCRSRDGALVRRHRTAGRAGHGRRGVGQRGTFPARCASAECVE